MKTISIFMAIAILAGCTSPFHSTTPVNFDGNYTGTNVVGVVYNLTLQNVDGVVSGQMTSDELHDTWVVSGIANNSKLAGKVTKGDLWIFELEAEVIPGDVIEFNPKNDLGLGDINFKKVN